LGISKRRFALSKRRCGINKPLPITAKRHLCLAKCQFGISKRRFCLTKRRIATVKRHTCRDKRQFFPAKRYFGTDKCCFGLSKCFFCLSKRSFGFIERYLFPVGLDSSRPFTSSFGFDESNPYQKADLKTFATKRRHTKATSFFLRGPSRSSRLFS